MNMKSALINKLLVETKVKSHDYWYWYQCQHA